MRHFIVLFSLVLILGNKIGLDLSFATDSSFDNSGATSDAICSSDSEIADLICFANRNFNGLSYVLVNFNLDKVVAVTSFYYDCQPGVVYDLRMINVLGYLIEVESKRGSNIFYINLVKDGPRIMLVPQSGKIFLPNGGLDMRLPATAVPRALAYLGFRKITANDYNAECNHFTQGTCGCSCSCSCQSPYILRTPAEKVSLRDCQTVVTGYLYNTNDNSTGAGVYANAYGLSCVKCRKEAQPQAGSSPPIYVETCSTTNNNKDNHYPSCKYDGPSQSFEVRKNCDDTLNNYEACELAESYEKAYSTRNTKGACFFSLLIIPKLYREPSYAYSHVSTRDAISYFLLKGFIPCSFRENIMKYLSYICYNRYVPYC